MKREKPSVDPRHTGPRKRRGGWAPVPPSSSFTLWVPNEHHEKLRKLAGEKKQSVGALVRQAIAEILNDGHGSPQISGSAPVPGAKTASAVRAVRKGTSTALPG